MIILTVCLVKVRMKFSLYKRVSYKFEKEQEKKKLETKAE